MLGRGDSQTDQQVEQTGCTLTRSAGFACGRLARLPKTRFTHCAHSGRLPVRRLLSLHVEQLRLRDHQPSAPYRMATKEETGVAEKKQNRLDVVGRDVSAGLMTYDEIAAKYGCSKALVAKKKARMEWGAK